MTGRGAVMVAAVLAAVAAAPAQAQVVRAGGGAPVTENSAPVLVSAAARTGERVVRWTVDTAVRCEGVEEAFDVSFTGTAPLEGNRFAGTATETLTGEGATLVVAVALEGAFRPPSASGRVRVAGELRREGRAPVDCTPGATARSWRARTLAAPRRAPVARPRAGQTLYGLGASVLRRGILAPVQLEVLPGRRVALVSAARATCATAPDLPLLSISPVARVTSSGRFRREERGTVRVAGATAHVEVTFAGRVRLDGVGGALRIRVRLAGPDGQTIDRCDTGLVEFSARP